MISREIYGIVFALLIQCFGCALARAQPAPSLTAKIQSVDLKPLPVEDNETVAYQMKFDVELTNQGVRAVSTGGGVFIQTVQFRKDDGRWHSLIQSSLIFKPDETFPTCSSVPAGGSLAIADIPEGLLFLKRQLKELGADPMIRFFIIMICRGSDGKDYSSSALRNGFVVRIPPASP